MLATNYIIAQQRNYRKALRSGGEVASSGSTRAIGDANAHLRSSGLCFGAKVAKRSLKPCGDGRRGLQ
jgi:hypothetical protein